MKITFIWRAGSSGGGREWEGADVVRWVFREAWPRKWEGPALKAMSNEVA